MQENSMLETDLPLDQAERLKRQLITEISSKHELAPYRNSLAIVAMRRDNDDVIVRTEATDKPFAIVHLTWQGQQTPPWPWTVFCASWEEVEDIVREEFQS